MRIGDHDQDRFALYGQATEFEKPAEREVKGLSPDLSAQELRRRSLRLWRARIARAELAALEKEKKVRTSLICLYFAVTALGATAASEFIYD